MEIEQEATTPESSVETSVETTETEVESQDLHEDDQQQADEQDEETESDEDQSQGDLEPETAKADTSEEDEDGEMVISIGDEQITGPDKSEPAPAWLKEMRQAHRDAVKENRELKKRLKSMETPQPKTEPLGPKPSLADYDYDTPEYEQALSTWYEKKREQDERERQQQAEQEQATKSWNERLQQYETAKKQLKLSDFDEAENTILENFDQTQQGIVISGADNPALVIYAMGKNEKRAKELASIKDPVKFAFAVAKLEKDMKVEKRSRTPPPPEKTVNGTGSKSAVDNQLERLREEAARTGNYSKVMEYKRRKRKA